MLLEAEKFPDDSLVISGWPRHEPTRRDGFNFSRVGYPTKLLRPKPEFDHFFRFLEHPEEPPSPRTSCFLACFYHPINHSPTVLADQMVMATRGNSFDMREERTVARSRHLRGEAKSYHQL